MYRCDRFDMLLLLSKISVGKSSQDLVVIGSEEDTKLFPELRKIDVPWLLLEFSYLSRSSSRSLSITWRHVWEEREYFEE